MLNLEETRTLIGNCIVYNVWICYSDIIVAVPVIKPYQVKVSGSLSISIYAQFFKKLIFLTP